jgi:hypothetical protein
MPGGVRGGRREASPYSIGVGGAEPAKVPVALRLECRRRGPRAKSKGYQPADKRAKGQTFGRLV